MDDIIDLESEKIELILAKIDSDPESMEVKQSERHLWEKIQHKTLQGRRTGVGITAEGDMLAAMNLRYGSEEATDFAELVQTTLALAAYRSSVVLAKERGAFPVFDAERERLTCRTMSVRSWSTTSMWRLGVVAAKVVRSIGMAHVRVSCWPRIRRRKRRTAIVCSHL